MVFTIINQLNHKKYYFQIDYQPQLITYFRTTPVPITTTEGVSREELCNNATIDAIVTVQDGTTYTFKGKE